VTGTWLMKRGAPLLHVQRVAQVMKPLLACAQNAPSQSRRGILRVGPAAAWLENGPFDELWFEARTSAARA